MIREQITINALRSSRLCVMVLSAQQALSTVDLGLIRLISNIRSRDVIIFVNRIDELADPARDVPAIRESILGTLAKFDGPTEAEIIFGSGYWAEHATGGTFGAVDDESADAMLSWAEAQLDETHADLSPQQVIWELSGLPRLGTVLAQRIQSDEGAKLLAMVENGLANLRASFAASRKASSDPASLGPCKLEHAEIIRRFNEIQRRSLAALDGQLAKTQNSLTGRIEKAHATFLERATASLIAHLDQQGETVVWTYDPAGLRMLLRSAFQVFVRNARRSTAEVFEIASNEMNALYREAFEMDPDTHVIEPAPLPNASAPVALGQTIALDLKGSWWTRFWRKRRGYQAFFDDFATLIHEETLPILNILKDDNAASYSTLLRDELAAFISLQRDTMASLVEPPPVCTDAFEFAETPRLRRRLVPDRTTVGSTS